MSALDEILQAAERIAEVGGPGISLHASLVTEAAAEITELRKDNAILDKLESICEESHYHHGIGIFHDYEDGWFLAAVDHGRGGLTLAGNLSQKDETVRAAILASEAERAIV